MNLVPGVLELSDTEDVGFYFKYLGGVSFTKEAAALGAPGATAMVAATNKHGLLFFSDLSGVYALTTRDILGKLRKDVASGGATGPNPGDACVWHQRLRDVTQLALSADEAVLAAVDSSVGYVSFFPLSSMRQPCPTAPHWQLALNNVRQFTWCKAAVHQPGSAAEPDLFLAVTSGGALMLGRYGHAASLSAVTSSVVRSADWCPGVEGSSEGSPALAYVTGRQLVLAAVVPGGSGGLGVQELAVIQLGHPQDPSAVFESVRWVVPDSLLLGATQMADDENEGDDELSCLLVMNGWAPSGRAPPQSTQLYTDIPGAVMADATRSLSGPYLHAVCVPRWGAMVRAHRKATDDHVRLLRVGQGQFGSGGQPESVSVTEDKLAIRLPNCPDGDDNFVLGLAINSTVPLDPLPHPLSTEKPPLAPPPVLLVMTSDAVLRLYGFGHLYLEASLRPGADAVMPLPAEPPAWVGMQGATGAPAGVAAAADAMDAAAKTALPDDDIDLADDSPVRPQGISPAPAPAPTAATGTFGRVSTPPPMSGATSAPSASMAPEDRAAGVALPGGSDEDEDDDLLDADEREARRAMAAVGVASDSESGEEVTSPGILGGSQTKSGGTSTTTSTSATTGPGASGLAFPAFGGGVPFGSTTSGQSTTTQVPPSGPFSGFGAFSATSAGSGFSLSGGPTPPAVPIGGFAFGGTTAPTSQGLTGGGLGFGKPPMAPTVPAGGFSFGMVTSSGAMQQAAPGPGSSAAPSTGTAAPTASAAAPPAAFSFSNSVGNTGAAAAAAPSGSNGASAPTSMPGAPATTSGVSTASGGLFGFGATSSGQQPTSTTTTTTAPWGTAQSGQVGTSSTSLFGSFETSAGASKALGDAGLFGGFGASSKPADDTRPGAASAGGAADGTASQSGSSGGAGGGWGFGAITTTTAAGPQVAGPGSSSGGGPPSSLGDSKGPAAAWTTASSNGSGASGEGGKAAVGAVVKWKEQPPAVQLQPSTAALESVSDVGFYFKYLGGLMFAAQGTKLKEPGATGMVVASGKYGLVFFSDLSGVYALTTRDILGKLRKDVASGGATGPNPGDACVWHQRLRDVTQLALSADEAVLAAVDSSVGYVSFFPLSSMRQPCPTAPHWQLALNKVRQFTWCKAAVHQPGSAAEPGLFLAVTAGGALMLGRYGHAASLSAVTSSVVRSADWCPGVEGSSEGSPALAYITGRQLVLAAVVPGGSGGLGVQELAVIQLEHPKGVNITFESVRWVLPDSLALGAIQMSSEDAEDVDEFSCLLALNGWSTNGRAAPESTELYTDTPGYVLEDATRSLSGPYLHAVCVPRWGAIVRAHRKATDDHVQLLRVGQGQFGSGGQPESVSITEDKLAIRLPNCPDGDDNFVLGLAINSTVPLDPLPHPLSTEKPPLTPPPVLLVMTSDAVLRLYGFGHLDLEAPLRPGADAVMPLPAESPAWVGAQGAAGAAPPASGGRRSSGTGEGSEVERRRAAAAARVTSDSESGEEVTSPGTKIPFGSFGTSGLTQPTFGAPAATTTSTTGVGVGSSTAPSFGTTSAAVPSVAAAAPGSTQAPSTTPGGGFGGGIATGPSFGFGFTAPATATSSTPASSTAVAGTAAGTATAGGGGGGLFGSFGGGGGGGGSANGEGGGGLFGAGGGATGFGFASSTGGTTKTTTPGFMDALQSVPASAAAPGGGGGVVASSFPSFGFGGLGLGGASQGSTGFGGGAGGGAVAAPKGRSGGGLFAPPPQALAPASDTCIPSATFSGHKPGFIFTTRDGVTGYYKDVPPLVPSEPSSAAPVSAPAPKPTAGTTAAAPKPTVAAPVKPTAAGGKPAATPTPTTSTTGTTAAQSKALTAPFVPPPRPTSPDVPAPKPHLSKDSQGASAESSFLRELHEVRKMAARLGSVMHDVAAGCPEAVRAAGGVWAGSEGGYKAVGVAVAALARRTAGLRGQYERANKRVAGLVDGLGALEHRLSALQLFSRNTTPATSTTGSGGLGYGGGGGGLFSSVLGGGGGSTPGAGGGDRISLSDLEANLPLEPALEALRKDVGSRLEALGSCLDELEELLESWEAPEGSSSGTSGRLSTSVLYNTLSSSGSALGAAATRVLVLAAKLEELGACPRGLLKDPEGPVARLASWCQEGGTSTLQGGGGGPVRTPGASRGGGTPASTAAGTPGGARSGTPTTTSDTPQWHTPSLPSGRRSPLLSAGHTPNSPSPSPTATAFSSGKDPLLRLEALARLGGKLRVTSAVRHTSAAEAPGFTLLQLMAAAEAARGALPDASEPSSPPRAQLKPTQLFNLDGGQAAVPPVAAKPAAPAQPTAFNFSTAAAGGWGSAAPTPSLKLAATGGASAAPKPPATGAAPAAATAAGKAAIAPAAAGTTSQTAPAAAPAAAAKPKAAQPPVPSFAQMQAASKLMAQVNSKTAAAPAAAPPPPPSPAAGSPAASTAAAPKPAPKPPANGGGGQPPVPPMSLFAQAAQLQQKMAQQGVPPSGGARPTDSGSSAGSTATSRPPAAAKPPPAAQPPVPSAEAMRAATAAQARLQQSQQPPAAASGGAPGTSTGAAPAQPSTQPPGGEFGFGFGFGTQTTAPSASNAFSTSSSLPATSGAPAASTAAAAPASSSAATSLFGSFAGTGAQGTSAATSGGGGSLFGAVTTPAAGGSLFGSVTGGGSIFGTTTAAPAAAAPAAGAGAASSPAAANATATAPAACPPAGISSPGAFNFGPLSFGSPAPGAAGAGASSAAASPLAAAAGGSGGGGMFGSSTFGTATPPAAAAGSGPSLFGALASGAGAQTSAATVAAGSTGPSVAIGNAAGLFSGLGFGAPAQTSAASSAAASSSPFGSFGTPATTGASSGTPTSLFGAPVATGASSSFGVFSTPTAPSAPAASTPSAAPPAATGGPFGGGSGPFGTSGGIQSKAAMPAISTGVFSSFGQSSAFGTPAAAAGGPGFGSPAAAAASSPAFGTAAPQPPAMPSNGTFGNPGFGVPSAFGSPAPAPPAAPAMPFCSGFGQSNAFGAAASGGNAFSGFAQQAIAGAGSGFGAFASSAPTPPATAGGGFAAFAGQSGGFGGFGAAAQQAPQTPGGMFGSAGGGGGFGAFGALGGGAAPAASAGGGGNVDLWKPRK